MADGSDFSRRSSTREFSRQWFRTTAALAELVVPRTNVNSVLARAAEICFRSISLMVLAGPTPTAVSGASQFEVCCFGGRREVWLSSAETRWARLSVSRDNK